MEAASLTVVVKTASFDAALMKVESSMEAQSMEAAFMVSLLIEAASVEAASMEASIMKMVLMELSFNLTMMFSGNRWCAHRSGPERWRLKMVILILNFENDYRIFKMTDRKKNIVTWQ